METFGIREVFARAELGKLDEVLQTKRDNLGFAAVKFGVHLIQIEEMRFGAFAQIGRDEQTINRLLAVALDVAKMARDRFAFHLILLVARRKRDFDQQLEIVVFAKSSYSHSMSA